MKIHYKFAALLALGFLTAPVLAGSNADAKYFAIYDQVNQVDIEIAQLGTIKGHSEEVRRIASTILRDHSAVQQMARDIAQDHGITFEGIRDEDLASSHATTMDTLKALNREEFDAAYLQHEVPFHRNASLAVRDQLIPSVHNHEFKTHLETVLPHFDHHLHLTLEAARKLGVEVE